MTQAMEVIKKVLDIKEKFPKNLMAKHFDVDYFDSLTDTQKSTLLECIHSGIDNPDSQIGLYAMNTQDYEDFYPYFSKVIYEYHHVKPGSKHQSCWNFESLDLPKDHVFDLTACGLGPVSMRVRVARNFSSFPLPCKMSKEDRINLENEMVPVFNNLISLPEFGGAYFSLTPGHPNEMSNEKYQQLVDEHIMFKDCTTDPYMHSVGLTNDWPYGRGCYISEHRDFIVWVGEEDHLRLISMKKGTILNEPFRRLKFGLDYIESSGLSHKFSVSDAFGSVTSCPSNLGTGMRASIHMLLPELAKKELAYLKEIALPLGLSVRGKFGENTPLGEGGLCDVSIKARFCISEAEIIRNLYHGLEVLQQKENQAAKHLSAM